MNRWKPGDEPVGELCLHCQEPIAPEDKGHWIAHTGLLDDGHTRFSMQPLHLECSCRMILGSVGHLKGNCSCFGGTEEDPPGMTKREAAKAVYELFAQGLPDYFDQRSKSDR